MAVQYYFGEITRGNANENIKDARFAELYHGRTALYYQYSTVKNSAGLVMPLRGL